MSEIDDGTAAGVVKPGELGEEVLCIRCGYDLRGLDVAGACPECGERVEVSLGGRGLGRADRAWVRRVMWGAGIAGGSFLAFWVSRVVISSFLSRTSLPTHLCAVVAFAAGGWGLWMATGREPGGPYFDDRYWVRRLIRLLGVVGGLAGVGLGLLEIPYRHYAGNTHDSIAVIQSWLGFVAGPGALITVMVLLPRYLAVLSHRLPSRQLSRHGHLSMLGLGGIVAMGGLVTAAASLFPDRLTSTLGILINCVAFALMAWPGVYCMVWAACVSRALRQYDQKVR